MSCDPEKAKQHFIEEITRHARYIGDGLVSLDSLVNHQLKPNAMLRWCEALLNGIPPGLRKSVTHVVVAEAGGIAPGFAMASLLDLPLIYARKKRPLTLAEPVYIAEAPGRTQSGPSKFHISGRYLDTNSKILLADDFLGKGKTFLALTEIVRACGAQVVAVACLIENIYEPGRRNLRSTLQVPVVSLARIDLVDGAVRVLPGKCED